jgi:hypothetical protein
MRPARSCSETCRSGSTILSKHDTYLDAEAAALLRWLHKSRDNEEPRSGHYKIVI